MRIRHKCFLCNKYIRSTDFPYNLFFWIEAGSWIAVVANDYGGQFFVCDNDFDWASKNKQIVVEMIRSKLKAMGYDLPMIFPHGDPNDA